MKTGALDFDYGNALLTPSSPLPREGKGGRGVRSGQPRREYMIATALKKGVTPRAEIGSARDAEYYLNLGVRNFCMGTDMRILFNWYVDHSKAMREVFASL